MCVVRLSGILFMRRKPRAPEMCCLTLLLVALHQHTHVLVNVRTIVDMIHSLAPHLNLNITNKCQTPAFSLILF